MPARGVHGCSVAATYVPVALLDSSEIRQVLSVAICDNPFFAAPTSLTQPRLKQRDFTLCCCTPNRRPREDTRGVRNTTHPTWRDRFAPPTPSGMRATLALFSALLASLVHFPRAELVLPFRGGGPSGSPPSKARATGGRGLGDDGDPPPIGEVVGAGAVGLVTGRTSVKSRLFHPPW